MQNCPSTILGITHSFNQAHIAYHPLSRSLVFPLQTQYGHGLGSALANDFRKMPSSERRKKGRNDKKPQR